MTMFDKIKDMSINELTEFLMQFNEGFTPWMDWFSDTYCNNCSPQYHKLHDDMDEQEFAWCELHDSCKYFQDMDDVPDIKQTIKMWLESEDSGV